jgi:hypothetical protein
MKTKNIIFLSFIAMIACAPNISAQGWLNKALKKVDDVSKKIDEGLTKLDDTSKGVVERQTTNPDYTGTSIKCTNPNLAIHLESCIRDGKLTVLSYSISNNGSDAKINYLGRSSMPKGQTNTSIFDSEGNQYQWKDLVFGQERYNGTDWLAPVILQEGVKVNCSVVLENVSKAANHLQKVTIGGWDFFLQFNNVPIYTVDDIINKDRVILKKENPAVESQNETYGTGKLTIKSVSVTENNTQVRILFQVPQNSNRVYAPDFDPDATIMANGKSYALLNAFGIPKHYSYANAYSLDAGRSAYIDLIFEKIPETTNTLDIKFGDLFWKSVWLVDPPKSAVSGTQQTSVSKITLSLQVNENQCFDGKPDKLIIKGGKPFANAAKPYKVEMLKNNYGGNVTLKSFKKGSDLVTVEIYTNVTNEGSYFFDESIPTKEKELRLLVTDAIGTTATIVVSATYCP